MLAMIPIALSPGASLSLAMSNVSSEGFRGVFKVIIGTGFGIVVHGMLVGLGISSFIVENVVLLSTLKLAGILFLFYLGIRLLLLARKSRPGVIGSLKSVSIQEAFLLNIFNAKAILFYLTVVPIFAGIHFVGYLYLSMLHVLIMAIWTSICSYCFVVAQKKFQLTNVNMTINIAGGLCLVYLSCVSALGLNS